MCKVQHELGLAVHVYFASTLKAETGLGGLKVLMGQPGLQNKILFKFLKKKSERDCPRVKQNSY